MRGGSAFIYLFTQNDKTLLYALDTGWLPEETWAYLAQGGPVLNCVVLDATYGPNAGCGGHLGLAEVIKAKEKNGRTGPSDREFPCACQSFFPQWRASAPRIGGIAEPPRDHRCL